MSATRTESATSEDLLELARDLDRFSRRFERFFLVQLEQLETEFQRLQQDRQQWERQRDRDLQQIQENRRALQDAWNDLRDGHADAANIQAPDLTGGDVEEEFCPKSASDPMRLIIRPGSGNEMLLAQMLLNISRLNRAIGGSGTRFELSDVYKVGTATLLDVHVFPVKPLSMYEGGEISDDVLRWQQFKSDVKLLPLGRGLDQLLEKAESIERDHELAQMFVSAAHRAQDGDGRTASSVKRGSKSARGYADQLVEFVERHQDEALAIQAVAN